MNERIRELADRIWADEYWSNPNTDKLLPAQLNKFAKLIVRECIDVALSERIPDEEIDMSDDIEDRCYLRGNNGGIVDAVIAMKQHFGVEE